MEKPVFHHTRNEPQDDGGYDQPPLSVLYVTQRFPPPREDALLRHFHSEIIDNLYGLRVDAVVEAIIEEHGEKPYRVGSENFALTVSGKQVAYVHKK